MKPLIVAAGLATLAHAFAIVPELSDTDSDIVTILPFEAPLTAAHQSLRLDCPGCPVTLFHHRQDGRIKKVDVPNHLELTFAVESGPGADRLLLNDFELYPNADPWHGALTAPQVMDFLETAMKHPPHRKGHGHHRAQLGYSLAIHPVAKEEDGQQLELVDIELQIIEVGETFVDGIPTVQVRLIKTPTGKLMIANIDTLASRPDQPAAPGKECETILCRWRAFVRNHLQRAKGFHAKCGAHMRHGAHKSISAPGEQEASLPEDGSRIVHHHYHTWKQLFKNITSYIFLPVLIGIVAGVSLSIIGMMVGTLAVCLWRLVVRRRVPWAHHHCRRRGHACHKANRSEPVVIIEEKSNLMDFQEEALPDYEAACDGDAAPAAPEATAQEGVDSKV